MRVHVLQWSRKDTKRWIKPQLLCVTKLLDGLMWFVNSFTDITDEPSSVNSVPKNKFNHGLSYWYRVSVFLRPNPLHFVPMVSKASYNGCDQRIIHVHSSFAKIFERLLWKSLCYIKHFETSSVTKWNCHEHVDKIWKQSENAQCEHRSYKNHFLSL